MHIGTTKINNTKRLTLFLYGVLKMNMIMCDKYCHHQKDGYCLLDKPASLTGLQAPCGYYTPRCLESSSPQMPKL